ncbi:MAG: hypothetical protein V1644_03140 [Candidatus Micrarchaeota archaeon]
MATKQRAKLLAAITSDLKKIEQIMPRYSVRRPKIGANLGIHFTFYRRDPETIRRIADAIREKFPGEVDIYNQRGAISRPWGRIHFTLPNLPHTTADISLMANNDSTTLSAFREATHHYTKTAQQREA